MWALALTLALSATPRHLAVLPADPDAETGDLERAVRNALRAALPLDTIQTHEDLNREATAIVDPQAPTSRQAAELCDLACAYGRDGLITTEKLVFGGRSRLKVSFFHPGNPVPVSEIEVPFERADRSAAAATAAVKGLLTKL
jgi:hypothetical protein